MNKKIKVLVVEDEVLVAKNLCSELEKLGITAIGPVTTGEEAVEMTKTQEPDLIIMDIRLPGKFDGMEAAVRIKEFRSVPIIFVTGYATDYIKEQADKVHCIEFFEKPIRIEQLIPILNLFK